MKQCWWIKVLGADLLVGWYAAEGMQCQCQEDCGKELYGVQTGQGQWDIVQRRLQYWEPVDHPWSIWCPCQQGHREHSAQDCELTEEPRALGVLLGQCTMDSHAAGQRRGKTPELLSLKLWKFWNVTDLKANGLACHRHICVYVYVCACVCIPEHVVYMCMCIKPPVQEQNFYTQNNLCPLLMT